MIEEIITIENERHLTADMSLESTIGHRFTLSSNQKSNDIWNEYILSMCDSLATILGWIMIRYDIVIWL